jgi:hypothetical protein
MSYSLRAANHGTAGRVTLPFRLASCALANLSCSYSRALLRVFSRCLSIGDDPRAAIRGRPSARSVLSSAVQRCVLDGNRPRRPDSSTPC